MVSHYDCAKQNNLRQFSLLNVEPCKQASEAYKKIEKVWCSQTFSSSRRYDRLQWGQNTLELPKILDPFECKNMIR